MHPAALHWAKLHVPELPRNVLDIGGADINCSLRNLYTWSGYLCVDIAPGYGVDVVAPFVDWATDQPGDQYDLIVCFEVLEHTPTWPEMIGSAHRLLEPGGRFVGTCASNGRTPHSAYGLPSIPASEYYRNVEPGELAEALSAATFDEFTVDVARSGLDLRWAATK